jgi:trimeric autotransporter adhesin
LPETGCLRELHRLQASLGKLAERFQPIFSDVFEETVPQYDRVGRGGFMRRYLTLVFLLFLALPAGISISGCVRNPAGNFCNGLGYGLKDTDVYAIDLEPRTTGISIAFGQTRQISAPTAKTCKGDSANVPRYNYGTTNNKLVDISPTGNICAGTWNRNSGGGIADYTICQFPNPAPSTGGLPYATASISASANSVTSNPVTVFVHAQVSAIALALVGQQQCYSQGTVAQLDSEACYVGSDNQQHEFCAPASVTHYACSGGLAPGVTSVPSCASSIGTLTYTLGTRTVASIDSISNQITAEQPGTTVVNASVAQSGSSAGYFSTCPPKAISVTLNGATSGTVTQGVQQNLTTVVTDTNGNPITGLTLDYQSTNPLNITAARTGGITANFPGAASVYAICQPSDCNPAPINQIGLYGTGLSVSSNPVDLTTPGTASAYMWFSAPGQSQYFVPVELLSGTIGSNVRLPYVPNSMVMDQSGSSLYFGSSHELMIYSTTNNAITKQDPNVPGVALAVSPDNRTLLINDPVRRVFYIYNTTGSVQSTQTGVANAAAWTPDSKTLYVSDSASLGTGHSDTLYVYNTSTGWTTYDLSASGGAANLALTVPGVGAYLSGNPTVAHTWCPTGTVGDYASMAFYPQGDSVNAQTDVLAATTDGKHILGAALSGGGVELSDIAVTIPDGACPAAVSNALQPLTIAHTLNQLPVNVNATAVNQVVASPASNLAFITYTGTTAGANLPYYIPGAGGSVGTLNYLTLTGGSAITAPVAGAFSPDDKLFFVSTAGDDKVHYIDVQTLTDTQQISPNLPACTPGTDPDCTLTTPTSGSVPATVILVKPRATT